MSGLPDQEPPTESSNSSQITLSAEQLNAIITNAVMAALQTAQSTQPQVTMPEIPKLITVQGLGTGALLWSVQVGTIVDLGARDCQLRVLLIDGTSREETTGDRDESYG